MGIWIKICATTSLEDALAAIDAGADALGFVFAESPRQVTVETVRSISTGLTDSVERVGVFVNHSPEFVAAAAERGGLTGIQLHGDEDEAYLRHLHRHLEALPSPPGVIKTLHFAELLKAGVPAYVREPDTSGPLVDRLLLDSGSKARRGGTGEALDWNTAAGILQGAAPIPPVILAGGLNPGNVQRAIHVLRPWGVDVVSGVETAPGKKDPAKLLEFVRNVRSALAEIAGESR